MKHLLAVLLVLFIAIACSNSELQVAKEQAANASARTDELKTALAQAQEKIDATAKSLQDTTNQLQLCMAKVGKQDDQTKALISSLGDELSQAQADLKTCQKGENAVIIDAAHRLCCMKRVDDPTIDSFSIENGKIVCTSNGDTAITC